MDMGTGEENSIKEQCVRSACAHSSGYTRWDEDLIKGNKGERRRKSERELRPSHLLMCLWSTHYCAVVSGFLQDSRQNPVFFFFCTPNYVSIAVTKFSQNSFNIKGFKSKCVGAKLIHARASQKPKQKTRNIF